MTVAPRKVSIAGKSLSGSEHWAMMRKSSSIERILAVPARKIAWLSAKIILFIVSPLSLDVKMKHSSDLSCPQAAQPSYVSAVTRLKDVSGRTFHKFCFMPAGNRQHPCLRLQSTREPIAKWELNPSFTVEIFEK